MDTHTAEITQFLVQNAISALVANVYKDEVLTVVLLLPKCLILPITRKSHRGHIDIRIF